MSSAGNAGQPLDEPRDGDRSHRPGNSLPALRRVEGTRELAIPSPEELDLALARADSLETLGELERMLGLLEEASRRFELAIDAAIQVAAYHLRAKRKLGGLLAQTVKWGGDRARSHDATLPPPSGLPQWLAPGSAASPRHPPAHSSCILGRKKSGFRAVLLAARGRVRVAAVALIRPAACRIS